MMRLIVLALVLTACSPVSSPAPTLCPPPLTPCEMRCQVEYYDCAESGVVVYSCSGVESACMSECADM